MVRTFAQHAHDHSNTSSRVVVANNNDKVCPVTEFSYLALKRRPFLFIYDLLQSLISQHQVGRKDSDAFSDRQPLTVSPSIPEGSVSTQQSGMVHLVLRSSA